MLLAAAIAHLKDALRRRATYKRLVAEISDLTDQEIHELGGNRAEMIRHTYRTVYGPAR
jgi:hypothetical protein